MIKHEKIRDVESENSEICLFCGSYKKQDWDDYTPFMYCDCKDVKHNEQVNKQIEDLKSSIRKPRYQIVKRYELVRLKK